MDPKLIGSFTQEAMYIAWENSQRLNCEAFSSCLFGHSAGGSSTAGRWPSASKSSYVCSNFIDASGVLLIVTCLHHFFAVDWLQFFFAL